MEKYSWSFDEEFLFCKTYLSFCFTFELDKNMFPTFYKFTKLVDKLKSMFSDVSEYAIIEEVKSVKTLSGLFEYDDGIEVVTEGIMCSVQCREAFYQAYREIYKADCKKRDKMILLSSDPDEDLRIL